MSGGCPAIAVVIHPMRKMSYASETYSVCQFCYSLFFFVDSLIHNTVLFCLLKWKRTGNLINLGRDTERKIIYQKRRKILIDCSVEPIHLLMCKTVDEGGFKGAHTANGDVRFSLHILRTYWPNWLKIMTDNDQNTVHVKRDKR